MIAFLYFLECQFQILLIQSIFYIDVVCFLLTSKKEMFMSTNPFFSILAGDPVVFSWGFGYGATWACLIFIFISLVLLICDRESEEIFYKERAVEEDEEEEEA